MKYYITILISLVFLQHLFPFSEHYYSFSRVTPEGGYVNSEIRCIAEDNTGVIWFGTKNGLYNYNAVEIKQFKNIREDSTTIPSNNIQYIYKDTYGRLWISTNKGICQYNLQSGNFRRLTLKDQAGRIIETEIIDFFEDKNHTFWFRNGQDFGTIDLDNATVQTYTVEKQTRNSKLEYNPKDNSIWLFYTDGEIYVKRSDENKFKPFAKIPAYQIYSVLFDNTNVWISFNHEGVICLSMDGNIKHQFNKESSSEKKRLPHNYSRDIIKVKDNSVWVATFEGIAVIEDFEVKYIIKKNRYPLIPHHSIWSLYKDSQNNIWVGTWKGGLCFHSIYNNQFQHYSVSSSNNSINDNYIGCIVGTPNKNEVLIGTENGGINIFDLNTNTFDQLPVYYNNDDIKNIKSLAYDEDETLWAGTHNDGVFYKKKNSGVFFKLKHSFAEGIQAYYLLPTIDGLWVCNYPKGVYFYDFSSKEFKEFYHDPLNIHSISSNNVRQIYLDKSNNLWFATEKGVNLMKKGSSEFIRFFHHKDNPKSISGDFIYSIAGDTSGNIWVGTNGYGLNKINVKTLEAEHFILNEGITGNEIFSITTDTEQNFWLATENGLYKFNPYSYELQSYSGNDNFNISLLTTSASIKKGQELFFGGSNGLIRFSPQRIYKNPLEPKVHVVDLMVNNKIVMPNDKSDILSEPVSTTTFIKLNYKQNNIGFRINNNNYINSKKNQFKYRLVGYTDNWMFADWLGNVDFYNLPPGLYTFEVKASNNSGVWNNNPTKIKIRITPPWWFSWYAYTVYVFIIVYGIFWYRRLLINKHKLIAEVEVEKVKNQSNEQIHQMKLQFFTNISHEFRTPLTLIRGPLDKLLRVETKPESVYLLNLISNNTNRMLHLVNQFLDFRKAETGNIKLQPVKDDVVSFIHNIFSVYKFLAEQQSIDYQFQADIECFNIDFDTDKLDKVLYNLLSNAFKNTPKKGVIFVKVQKEEINDNFQCGDCFSFVTGEVNNGHYVSITVSDNGYGIPQNILPNIFDSYFIGNHNKSGGTGIGLSIADRYVQLHHGCIAVNSNEGSGTTFKIYLPVNQTEVANSTRTISKTNQISVIENAIADKFEAEQYVNKNITVLVVEDNLELQTYIRNILSEYYIVVKANNGEIAFEQALTLSPDIIISDIMMPIMDGIELCQKLKTDIRTSHIPVILLTALETIKDRIKGISRGADAYVSKPFNDELLIVQIHNLLKSRNELRQLFSSHEANWEEKISSESLDKKFVIKATKITEDNMLDVQFSVELLAEKLNISRTHLHRKLKALTDQSATEFIRYVRLKHAIALMKDGKYKVNEVGFAVGFNSHHYFTKSFKKQFGVSPSEFINLKNFKENGV